MANIIRLEARHFVAGLVLEHGVVVRAAPIVRYMQGWARSRVLSYARSKGWDVLEQA